MKTATLAALIASAIACNPPTASVVRVESDRPWTAAGDRACVTQPVPASDPPCGASPVVAPSGIAVWSTGRIISLEASIGEVLVPGLDRAAILRCDLRRFPMPEVCTVSMTCDGADVVLLVGYVQRVAAEFVRVGRCW